MIPISCITNKEARIRYMENMLPPELITSLKKLALEAEKLESSLFIVGGFVRDLILEQRVSDLDLVIEGDAIQLANRFISKYGGKAFIHQRFKTVRITFPNNQAEVDPLSLDIVSSRKEKYPAPGALPEVMSGTIIDDLYRRDFSINTLAIRLDGIHYGDLYDYFGGLDDLKKGILRVLHPDSIKDDPTRIFRATRYALRYDLIVSTETQAYILSSVGGISRLSAQRLRHELDLILNEEKAGPMLMTLSHWHALQNIHPCLIMNQNILKRMEIAIDRPSKERRKFAWAFWMMDYSCQELEELDTRLHFSAGIRNFLLGVSNLNHTKNTLTGGRPSQIVRRLNQYPLDSVFVLFLTLPKGKIKINLHNYLNSWRFMKPKTTGHILKERGLLPGPVYEEILQNLRAAWLDGIIGSKTEEDLLLEELINKKLPENEGL